MVMSQVDILLLHFRSIIKLKGNLWIVPNLNGHSIMANRREFYNDMNRKFNIIDKKDPDYFVVERIKK